MIYANYAATTHVLSPVVVKELRDYVSAAHLNAARNFEGLEAGAITLRARRAVAKLFGVADPLRVILTSGATQSLNMAINGLASPGDHVLATSVEHNATARPLECLRKCGAIELDWLRCEPDGSLDPQTVRKAIRKNTKLLVMTHASNVLGTILPVAECFTIAREYGIRTILDAAQTASGTFSIAFDKSALGASSLAFDKRRAIQAEGGASEDGGSGSGGSERAGPGAAETDLGGCCDVMAFTGHKGLGGLAGSGGFVIGEDAAAAMRPWIRGGTGSVSDSLDMPEFLPDKFEPGTQNTIGALGIAVSIEEILRGVVEKIREHECKLTARFIAGLRTMKKITIYGTGDAARSVALVSIVVEGYDAGDLSRQLFEKHGIITRSGLHCAPLAHMTAGTYPSGAVRFSFGSGTTEGDIDTMLLSLARI
ncbi:MAG: aminotransferase class V-fold PLP-dependent enzyme [Spirochaetaceae bacterium]|jgi:selenocysteine lyase/cysteine desulfurase|nr:aminotransferase class V-fold PLP-dependent enzyme [Spirochaetaceae bacterium]